MRRHRAVLEASSIRLQPGSRVGLVGRNGAGKSSLVLALAGLLKRGRVRDWGERGAPLSTALVAQHPGFPAGVRVRSVLRACGVRSSDLDIFAPGLVAAAVLEEHSNRLSIGQRQRVATAVALARRDQLVLLDEPFSSLDVPGRIALRKAIELRFVRQPEATVVIAAHAPADLFGSCTSIVALAGGRATQLPVSQLAPSGDLGEFEQALATLLETGI